MFKLSEIKELIKLVDSTTVQELEIENEGSRLMIRKPNHTESVVVTHAPATHTYAPVVASTPVAVPEAAAPVQQAVEPAASEKEDADLHRIVSPMVGTFYRASAPGAAPFVNKGDTVNEKTVVCILEAMKLMNPIDAEIKGEIVDILVENGQLVEYGQPLFLVKPE